MEVEKYQQLAEKWMNGTITPEEEVEFAHWYNERQNEEVRIPGAFVSDEDAHRRRIWEHIQALKTAERIYSSSSRWTLLRVAAAVLVLLVSGSVLWWYHETPAPTPVQPMAGSIRPGATRARLTLSNGSVVDLDSAKEGRITGEASSKVDKQADQLVYNAPADATPVDATPVHATPMDATPVHATPVDATPVHATPVETYNTLSTPRGGMYSIVLSDGTKVWLDAASSLRYPTAFNGQTRAVSLTGEAYFEVAPNPAKPFKVFVNGMEVNVLGTHFDVMAYDDEAAIATTLLEGAVKVRFGENSVALEPGQQSLLQKDGNELLVRDVDAGGVVAWKDGIFQFKSEDIHSVMRKIARWYDVDVQYEGEIKDHFSGAVHRDTDVSGLLRIMELSHEVHFHIEGRTILVSP